MKLNIAFIDVIKQISKYAKFLKELCTTKRAFMLKGYETVSMGIISTVVQKNLSLKQNDLSAFTISCVIANASFKRALCDLGASISVMPKHVYDFLSLEPLIKTSIVIIQLVDRSFIYPLGVIKDVLVNIDSLVIPCDFYILDMERDSCDSSNNTPILFGRPFLKTTNTKLIVVRIICPCK